MTDHDKLFTELLDLLAKGRKIEAIKRFREATGVGLAEAKAAVERLEQGSKLSAPAPGEPTLEGEVLAQFDERGKIAAIRHYREVTGAGLKEAKDAVEAIAARHGYAQPTKAGCLTLIGLIMVTAVPPLIELLSALS
jgi:ribosomal protein L7/L12